MPIGIYKRKGNELDKANKCLHYVGGTKLEALTQKTPKNNKSTGIKGISYIFHKPLNKYVYKVSIQLAKKRYYKTFYTLDEAIEWRNEMEEKLYKPLLKNKILGGNDENNSI